MRSESMRGPAIGSHFGLLRARPVAVLLAGMLGSVALSALFYSVSSLLHPPSQFGQPGAPATTSAWIAAYASWSQTHGDLATGLRVSVVAAIVFGGAAVALLRPRAAFVASFALLNILFAWSSSAFGAASVTLLNDVTKTIYLQDSYVLDFLNLQVVTGDTYIVADLESLALLIVIAASVLVTNVKHGYPRAVVHAVRAVAGCFVILGVEIALFDYKEFYMHATQTQQAFGWATWISNADLLFAGAAVFAVSFFVLRSNKRVPLG